MTKQRMLTRFSTVLMCVVMMFAFGVNVNAATKPLTEITSTVFNKSVVSSNEVYLGESVTIFAKTSMLNAQKCKYAYLAKYENTTWTTMADKTTVNTCTWTPKSVGKYTVCVKVYSSLNIIYKKFMTVNVLPKLENESVIGASYINEGGSVAMSACAKGGKPSYQYAFYSKKEDASDWNVLSKYSSVDTMSWMPSEAGVYDVCIKVKDSKEEVSKKYFKLNVVRPSVTPAEYTLIVSAPMSAPYQWDCELEDEDILSVSEPTVVGECDVLHASVALEYRIKTLRAGMTSMTLTYHSYSGNNYAVKYQITVDRSLNAEVVSSDGEYFTDNIPEPKRVTKEFSVTVENKDDESRWSCIVTDPNVTEVISTETLDEAARYTYSVLRPGRTAINLLCKSRSGTVTDYYLVYNLLIDEDLNITVESSDGYYIEESDLPPFVYY